MRRTVAALALAVGLSAASTATRAEPEPAPSPPGIGFAGKKEPAAPAAKDGRSSRWGDGKTGRGPEPIAEPAKDGSYNLIHITYAAVIMLAMLAFTLWLIRRNRRRD